MVTGGAGFIGSAVVRDIVRDTDWIMANVDKLTYAENLESLAEARDSNRHTHFKVDIGDQTAIDGVLQTFRPDAVLHLAAESHVDRSIDGAAPFIETNIGGTYRLLEATLGYWRWRPRRDFEAGLRQTVRWYLDNRDWWERVMSGAYRGERLGLAG